MKLFFSWGESAGAIFPTCCSNVVNKDGVSPLACLLTDDGGQGFLDTLSWLDEGMARMDLVKKSKVDFSDWSRDAWGAELTKKHVKVYSLHDEEYFELLSVESFESALSAWSNFIRLKPELGVTREIEI